jgi:hypothetical protein
MAVTFDKFKIIVIVVGAKEIDIKTMGLPLRMVSLGTLVKVAFEHLMVNKTVNISMHETLLFNY